ncbi:hypothetical protein [Rhizobium sp. Leaf383]|uniref:hypothetical protein n=1 Tax=Rhizobium sp. Leaf383 TaxID=1736357 RepID=UPI0007162224|nr:hypothetical protein [Rhizobium sp. Leaf383]KQS76428.1 hypothetical protein ASG58_11435 [Rhizobium sp. Leaf383]
MAGIDYKRDALRLLFILNAAKARTKKEELVGRYPYCFRGEKRLQAMDFWVRYPDYLSLELLNQYRSSEDASLLARAREIYDADEPSLRTIPMLRNIFGAYEPLDTALSILECRGLVKSDRRTTAVGHEYVFYLPPSCADFCKEVVSSYPSLGWYAERAALVTRVAGDRSGNELKSVQHAQREYHDTNILDHIPTITERVKAELDAA